MSPSSLPWLRQIQTDLLSFLGLERGLAFHPSIQPRLETVVRALGQTYFPPHGPIPFSADDVDVLSYLTRMLQRIEPDQAQGLTVVFLAIEYLIPPLFAYKGRFSSLPPADREALLRKLLDSSFYPFRMLSTTLKIFFSMAYLSDPRVLREIDFFKIYPYPSDPRPLHLRPSFFASRPPSAPEATDASASPASNAAPASEAADASASPASEGSPTSEASFASAIPSLASEASLASEVSLASSLQEVK